MKYLKLFESNDQPPSVMDYFYDIVDTGVDFVSGDEWTKCEDIIHQEGMKFYWRKWICLEYDSIEKYIPEDIAIAILRMNDDGFYIKINVENPKKGQGRNSTIEKTETGRWYLLGVSKLDTSNLSVLAHEMAHGMWYIDPSYKNEMSSLLNSIPKEEFDKLKKIIFDVGYAESSLIDECQAYLSTGLIDGMTEYEKYEPSFRKVFEKYNTHHSIKSPKPVKIDFI